MNNATIKQKRITLELEILRLITDFQQNTKAAVSDLQLSRGHSRNPAYTEDVQINVEWKS